MLILPKIAHLENCWLTSPTKLLFAVGWGSEQHVAYHEEMFSRQTLLATIADIVRRLIATDNVCYCDNIIFYVYLLNYYKIDYKFDIVPKRFHFLWQAILNSMQVQWLTGETSILPWVWLRDNCQCSKCFDTYSQNRTFHLKNLDLQIQPTNTTVKSISMNEWLCQNSSLYYTFSNQTRIDDVCYRDHIFLSV